MDQDAKRTYYALEATHGDEAFSFESLEYGPETAGPHPGEHQPKEEHAVHPTTAVR